MCGITIFLSKLKNNIVKDIITSLKQIQNRGYDSVGIALRIDDWRIYKYASDKNDDGLDKLNKKVMDFSSNMAMGHTRWATHGGKTDNNSHPHISMNGKIILVHNGIISNFKEISNFLLENDYIFYSETDTEVIANLIEFYLRENSISNAIELATKKMIGTWALGIICTENPEIIFVTRHGSPLLLGSNDNIIICCSEIAGFIGHIYDYISLENNDIITINSSGYISDKTYPIKRVSNMMEDSTPAPFLHWTMKEINDQPNSILAALNNGARILDNNIILGGLSDMKVIVETKVIEHLMVIGCGTSYHASMFAKYYFNTFPQPIFNTIQSFDGSEFTKLDIPKRGKVLAIVCSQSGETMDLIKAIEICKDHGCILLGIVNVVDSLIAQTVDYGVYMNAGREMAVPSTKSFTATLIILSLIGMWFKNKYMNIPILKTLRILPNLVQELLVDNTFKQKCEEIVEFINIKNIRSIFLLGREKMYPITKEIALKIKEIAYIHAEGYPGGSLKHGPFALLDDDTMTFLLIDEKNTEYLTSTYYEITARNSPCYIITDSPTLSLDSNTIRLPNIPYYREVIFTIALQYLSYVLSISRNINPDKPRNLAKVVTVE
jgi:glucosamine--fructose-6-phosphate aminotransferase (isomerizing)